MEGQKGRRYIYPTEPAPNQPNLIKKQEKTNNPPLSGSCQSCRPPQGGKGPPKPTRAAVWKGKAPKRGSRTRLPPGDSAPPEARRPRPPSPLHLPESPESPGPSEPPPAQGPEAPRAYPEAAPGQTSFPLEDRHLSGLTTGREYLNKSS